MDVLDFFKIFLLEQGLANTNNVDQKASNILNVIKTRLDKNQKKKEDNMQITQRERLRKQRIDMLKRNKVSDDIINFLSSVDLI